MNMQNFMKWLAFALQAVLIVQQAIPAAGGASKKNLATAIVTAAAGITGTAPEAHLAEIGQAIDFGVNVLKTAGVLTKDAPPAITTPLLPA
jgi:hypothetical protein